MKRESIIRNAVLNKRVLDVGCVGQARGTLQHIIRQSCSYYVGTDIQSAPNVIRANIEYHSDKIMFHAPYDVIILGDLIEHLSNPGRALEMLRMYSHSNTILLLTTPNAKWPTVFLKPNPEHTCWHDRHTITELLKRSGWVVDSVRYYPGNKPSYGLLWPFVCRQGLIVSASVRV